MLEGGKISYRQMILLLFIDRVVLWITYLPVLLAPPANQDVWLDCLMGFPIHLLIAFPLYLLYKKFPKQTFYEYLKPIAGKAGLWIGIFYLLYITHIASLVLSNTTEFFTTVIMPETPPIFFKISLTLVAAFAASKGIEVLGRLSEIFAPIIILAVIGVILLLIQDMDFKELTPILESGIYPAFLNGLSPASQTIEIIGMAIIFPFLNDPQKAKKVYLLLPALLELFLFILTTSVIALFGSDLAKTFTFPFFSLVRLVQVGDFLERIESIHVAIWVFGMFLRLAFYYYLIILGLGQLFNLKRYTPLILPTGTILVSLSLVLGQNVVATRKFISFEIYTWYMLLFIFLIPSLLLLTALIRKKGVRLR